MTRGQAFASKANRNATLFRSPKSGEIAMSVGCMLSRVRTGMSNNEVTCAIPESRVSEFVERLRAARIADKAVAAYAAADSKRFARHQ